jgi:EmrB/QacA subfamily drug resistance transporter
MYTNLKPRPGLLLATVALIQFTVSLDLSVVNVALPSIATDLRFSPVGVTWVIHAYALLFGGLLLLGGKAADRYGRRRLLLAGLALFGVASLLGGLAQEPAHLVAARAAQGVGAAALAPAALALLTAAFPSGRERIRAFGVWSAVNAAGGALGVLIGGLLTEFAGWQWVMFVNVPIVAAALVLAWRGIAADAPARPRGRPDVLGAVLATAGMILLVLGIIRTERYGWASAEALGVLAAAAVLLAAFGVVERTTRRDALVRPGLLANRSVAGANIYNLLLGGAMAAAFYFVSLYVQRVLGTGPALTGLQFLPLALGVIVGSVIAVRLGYRLPARAVLVGGALVTAAGFAWFGLISPDGGFLADVLGPAILVGTGFGLCLGPLVATATAGVATAEAGTASALLNSSRQIGAALGLAALGTVAHHRSGDAPDAAALNDGYALGLWLCAAAFVTAALVAAVVLPRTAPAASEARREAELSSVE